MFCWLSGGPLGRAALSACGWVTVVGVATALRIVAVLLLPCGLIDSLGDVLAGRAVSSAIPLFLGTAAMLLAADAAMDFAQSHRVSSGTTRPRGGRLHDVLEFGVAEQRRFMPDVADRLTVDEIGPAEAAGTVIFLIQLLLAAVTSVGTAITVVSRRWQLAVVVTVSAPVSAVVAKAYLLPTGDHAGHSMLIVGEMSARLLDAVRGLHTAGTTDPQDQEDAGTPTPVVQRY